MPKKPPFHTSVRQITVYFREWRAFRQLTQQQLADRIGTSKTRVSMKENGKEGWDDGYLAALAEALGIDEPASLLMRNPVDDAAPWSLLEGLKPDSRAKVLDYIEVLKRAEESKERAA